MTHLLWNGDLCAVVGIMALWHIRRSIWAAIWPTIGATASIEASYVAGAWRFVQCNWGARHLVNAKEAPKQGRGKNDSLRWVLLGLMLHNILYHIIPPF